MMDTPKKLWIVFAACCLLAFVSANADDSETDKYTEWKKNLCENRNRTFNNDMHVCWLTEPKAVLEASRDCIGRAVPSANGHLVEFLEVACKDKTAFLKYNECNTEYESNEEYKKQMEVSSETVACYDRVLTKYGLPTLSGEATTE